ncbi:MAG: hypothetical protein ACO396_09070, partial [Phycisphaerales bacterium]
MTLEAPSLTQRIPTPPWGDPRERRTVDYARFVATDGYKALESALDQQPSQVIETVKAAVLRGRGGAGVPPG